MRSTKQLTTHPSPPPERTLCAKSVELVAEALADAGLLGALGELHVDGLADDFVAGLQDLEIAAV